MIKAKYVHTNLIAKDWRKLQDFYEKVFGCEPVPPERDLSGEELEAGTGIVGARIRGIHLRLPGYGEEGPTLEIFSYNVVGEESRKTVNRQGYAHIAFLVDDVEKARDTVVTHGGNLVGEIVTLAIEGRGKVTFCYVADPEDNIIELQSWSASHAK
jgi:catechol 2,3-dioxygenase-like lactoylglutathione lyase family enzyme